MRLNNIKYVLKLIKYILKIKSEASKLNIKNKEIVCENSCN